VPTGLGAAGAALWKRLTAPVDGDELEFSVAELVTLELACRQADDISALEQVLAHDGPTVLGSREQVRLSPIPAELRLQRAALARLVAQLAPPDPMRMSGWRRGRGGRSGRQTPVGGVRQRSGRLVMARRLCDPHDGMSVVAWGAV